MSTKSKLAEINGEKTYLFVLVLLGPAEPSHHF